jgi:hypothetical protein
MRHAKAPVPDSMGMPAVPPLGNPLLAMGFSV